MSFRAELLIQWREACLLEFRLSIEKFINREFFSQSTLKSRTYNDTGYLSSSDYGDN